jgi:hypothetical protein
LHHDALDLEPFAKIDRFIIASRAMNPPMIGRFRITRLLEPSDQILDAFSLLAGQDEYGISSGNDDEVFGT